MIIIQDQKKINMSICRECKKEIHKYTTMFGYCPVCCRKLGAKMNKIKWDMDKEDSFLRNAKTLVVCTECGYLVKNPDVKDEKCPNCGLNYEKTKSYIVKS